MGEYMRSEKPLVFLSHFNNILTSYSCAAVKPNALSLLESKFVPSINGV